MKGEQKSEVKVYIVQHPTCPKYVLYSKYSLINVKLSRNFLLNLHVGPKFTALHLHRVWNPYTFRARQIPPPPENLGIWKI